MQSVISKLSIVSARKRRSTTYKFTYNLTYKFLIASLEKKNNYRQSQSQLAYSEDDFRSGCQNGQSPTNGLSLVLFSHRSIENCKDAYSSITCFKSLVTVSPDHGCFCSLSTDPPSRLKKDILGEVGYWVFKVLKVYNYKNLLRKI